MQKTQQRKQICINKIEAIFENLATNGKFQSEESNRPKERGLTRIPRHYKYTKASSIKQIMFLAMVLALQHEDEIAFVKQKMTRQQPKVLKISKLPKIPKTRESSKILP